MCVGYLVLGTTMLHWRVSEVVQGTLEALSHPRRASESDFVVEMKGLLGLPLWGKRDDSRHVERSCYSHQSRRWFLGERIDYCR